MCRSPYVERDSIYNGWENQSAKYSWSSEAVHGTQKIKFNEGENFKLKDQTSVRREILLSKNSNENELVI